MAISLSRATLQLILGRRCLLRSSASRLFASDDDGSRDKKTDLQSLLDKMKQTNVQKKDKELEFQLKAQPLSKKISDSADSDSSSSSDSSDSDEDPLDIVTEKVTEEAAAHTALKANLDKNSVKNDLTKQLQAMRKDTKIARNESEVSGVSENLLGSLKVLKESKRQATNTSIGQVSHQHFLFKK